MIEQLRPEGDMADLVYSAEYLVEQRFATISTESVQAATGLFRDVCLELYRETKQNGVYSKELAPLLNSEESELCTMLQDVVSVANKLILSEYTMRACREQDPRLPSHLFARPRLCVQDAVKYHLNEIMAGAELGGHYRLEAFISSGAYAHGWRARDLQTDKEVFVKTYKCKEEFGKDADHQDIVKSIMLELETAERISRLHWLMDHPNFVSVLKVLRPAPCCTASKVYTQGQR